MSCQTYHTKRHPSILIEDWSNRDLGIFIMNAIGCIPLTHASKCARIRVHTRPHAHAHTRMRTLTHANATHVIRDGYKPHTHYNSLICIHPSKYTSLSITCVRTCALVYICTQHTRAMHERFDLSVHAQAIIA